MVTIFEMVIERVSRERDVYKIYSESFKGEQHLADILTEARQILDDAFGQAAV